jgi:hypothetical protein
VHGAAEIRFESLFRRVGARHVGLRR